jgi:hypothetical protein
MRGMKTKLSGGNMELAEMYGRILLRINLSRILLKKERRLIGR